jgi:hypothetical protein
VYVHFRVLTEYCGFTKSPTILSETFFFAREVYCGTRMIIAPAEIHSVKRSALLQVIDVVQNTDHPLVSNAINTMTADKIHTCHCGGLNVAEKCTY